MGQVQQWYSQDLRVRLLEWRVYLSSNSSDSYHTAAVGGEREACAPVKCHSFEVWFGFITSVYSFDFYKCSIKLPWNTCFRLLCHRHMLLQSEVCNPTGKVTRTVTVCPWHKQTESHVQYSSACQCKSQSSEDSVLWRYEYISVLPALSYLDLILYCLYVFNSSALPLTIMSFISRLQTEADKTIHLKTTLK